MAEQSKSHLPSLLILLAIVLYMAISIYTYDGSSSNPLQRFNGLWVPLWNSFWEAIFLPLFTNTSIGDWALFDIVDQQVFRVTDIMGSFGSWLGETAAIFIFAVIIFCVSLYGLKSEKLKEKYGVYFTFSLIASSIVFIATLLKDIVPKLASYLDAIGGLAVGIAGVFLGLKLIGTGAIVAVMDLIAVFQSKKAASGGGSGIAPRPSSNTAAIAGAAYQIVKAIIGLILVGFALSFIIPSAKTLSEIPGFGWLNYLVVMLSAVGIGIAIVIGAVVVGGLSKFGIGKWRGRKGGSGGSGGSGGGTSSSKPNLGMLIMVVAIAICIAIGIAVAIIFDSPFWGMITAVILVVLATAYFLLRNRFGWP